MYCKTMSEFEFFAPDSVEAIFKLLKEFGTEAKLMLGGTDLIPKMKARVSSPKVVISLGNVKEFNNLVFSKKEGLRIGCGVTLKELEDFPVVKKRFTALYEGIHSIASTQIRNVGTVVGNICNAVPSADSAPGLLVLNASVKLICDKGERIVPINEFFTGVCKTILKPDEIVSEVIVPTPALGSSSIYYAHTIRRALDLAIVGVAVSVDREGDVCKDVKIGLGAVAITPKRAVEAENILIGQTLNAERIEEAAMLASRLECAPISDMRASEEHRREIVRVLTRNALEYCWNRS